VKCALLVKTRLRQQKEASALRKVIKEGHFDKIFDTHYSEGVRVGNMVFVAGQLAVDDNATLIGKGDPDKQARKIFDNMKEILEEAGASLQDVVMLNLYVTDIALISKIAPARRAYFGSNRPVATLVEVSKLAVPGALLEVNAIAVVDSK
jgi:enamine deaminase RidA (YjgF/YER057c/UK114 family)